MGTEIDVKNIENLSHEELVAMEDKLAADDASAEQDQPEEHAEQQEKPSDQAAEKPDDGAKADDGKTTEPAAEVKGDDKPKVEPEPEKKTGEDDIKEHVSPPSKWAQERHEKRQLKQQLDEFKAKAEKADTMEQEFNSLREELDWLKSAVQSKGVELPKSPADMFSDERINEIREEFGNELADMFTATKAMIGKQSGPQPQPKTEAKAEPQPQHQAQPAQPEVDPKLLEAIDNNDELSYWREQSQPLWNKAVEQDTQFLANDPEYAKLSYEDRFTRLVTEVKNSVMQGAKPETAPTENAPPAASLSGSSGVAPTQENNSAIDRVLAADSHDKQLQAYNALSESERDEVDKALGI